MNITKENIDALNATLKINIVKADYEEKVAEVLKDYKKKARVNGFRPGHVPMGLVNKLYRTPVKVEEINKLISESINNYITEQKLDILGEPLPADEAHRDIDWETQEDFDFSFDLGLAPAFEIPTDKKTKIPYYKITVGDDLIKRYNDDVARRHGIFILSEKIEGDDLVKGDLAELAEDGNTLEGGVLSVDAILSLDVVKEESIKELFKGKQAGDTVVFELKKAFPNETDLKAMLRVEKDKIDGLQPMFSMTISEVKRFEPAAIDQKLFDQLYGESIVNSEEEHREKVIADIQATMERDSDYRFGIDAREVLVEKTSFDLPVEFLKRWMLATNDGKITAEQIEKDMDHFITDLKWQLIKNKIAKENEIKITEEEIREYAKTFARNQYLRYGLANIPDEYIENYANEMLKNKDEVRRFADNLVEEKVRGWIKGNVKIDDKEVTVEEFNKLFEK
ncbi:MAG: trigger factor [Bacteroidales bacterium]